MSDDGGAKRLYPITNGSVPEVRSTTGLLNEVYSREVNARDKRTNNAWINPASAGVNETGLGDGQKLEALMPILSLNCCTSMIMSP
jgi:hypothetical protein